ncbi:MAG: hypothetical protein ACLP9L_05150 [Thermoguttaceae bacterium]
MKFDATKYFLPALLAAVVAVGCQSIPYLVGPKQVPVNQAAPPVSQLASPDTMHTSQWEAGRATYLGECANCHKPKPIQEFAIDDWESKIIPGMAVKAKLTPEQTQSLAGYIMAVKRLQLLGGKHVKAEPATSQVSASDK